MSILLLYVSVNCCKRDTKKNHVDRVTQSVDVRLPQSLSSLMLAQWNRHGGSDRDCTWTK